MCVLLYSLLRALPTFDENVCQSLDRLVPVVFLRSFCASIVAALPSLGAGVARKSSRRECREITGFSRELELQIVCRECPAFVQVVNHCQLSLFTFTVMPGRRLGARRVGV